MSDIKTLSKVFENANIAAEEFEDSEYTILSVLTDDEADEIQFCFDSDGMLISLRKA